MRGWIEKEFILAILKISTSDRIVEIVWRDFFYSLLIPTCTLHDERKVVCLDRCDLFWVDRVKELQTNGSPTIELLDNQIDFYYGFEPITSKTMLIDLQSFSFH